MFKPDTLIIKEAKVSEHNKIIEIFTHYNNISVCSTFISFKRMKLHIQFHFFLRGRIRSDDNFSE